MLWKEGRAGWFPPDQTSGLWLTWLGSIQVLLPRFSTLAALAESSCVLKESIAPSPLLHKLFPSLSLNNFISPSLIVIFPNGQGFPQPQLPLPLWSVSFDNSESTDWSHLLLPIPTLSIPFPSGSHCHIPRMLSLLSPSSWLCWKISRPRDLGLAPSATPTQIICKASQCLPAFQLLPVLQRKEF